MWKRNNMVLLSLSYWLYHIYFMHRLAKFRKKDKINKGKFLRIGPSNDQ